MPAKRTIAKAKRDKRQGKSATTQAGEFVHEEIKKIRRGEHGARSAKQAIAIGLSEARRAGVDLPPPAKGKAKAKTRKSARYAYGGWARPAQNQAPPARRARRHESAEAGTDDHCFAQRPRAPSEDGRQAAQQGEPHRGRAQGGEDQRRTRPLGRG
jgi:hypothetical protein